MWRPGSNAGKPAGNKKLDVKNPDAVFTELMLECRNSVPGARFSKKLRAVLEKMRPEQRRALCSRTRDGCAPLFVASQRGNAEAVEYLVHVCAAELEQRGVYEVQEEHTAHSVTPLWCAAVAGRLATVRVLADAGADLDAASDSGSTPVRSACYMSRVDVVEFLVERGADVDRPNHSGGTCLINSVQSLRLLKLLLERGAAVDARDIQHKTALHYAVQEQRVDAARLLLQYGANPRLTTGSGDDALRLACLKGATAMVEVLSEATHFCPARVGDAFELLGATQLDEFNDMSAALNSWRRATAFRNSFGPYISKQPPRPPQPALGRAREWRTSAELEALAADVDAVRTQSLLVAERVLGPAHRDTLFRLMYRGASYADSYCYQRCIDLWTWALQIRIETDSLLYCGADRHVSHGVRADAAAAGRARQPAGARARAAAPRGRDARVRAAGRPAALVPALAGRAPRAQEAGGGVRPRAALRHAPAAPAGGDARAAARGGVRARAPPAGRGRAQRQHRRHAAAPRRLAPQRATLHVLHRRDACTAGVPVGGGGVAAAGVRRRPLPAQRGALHAAARRRHTVQLLHGAGGASAGGRRAHRPAQQVRRQRGRAGDHQPRLARLPAALHHPALPRRARAARLAPPRAARRAAAHAAPLPAAAPPLGAARCRTAPLRRCATAPLRHCATAPLQHCDTTTLRHYQNREIML